MARYRVEIKMKVPILVEKDEPGYVSRCPPLDICSQGETKKEARENLIEAMQLFVESCFERGVLDSVLKDCGLVRDGEKMPIPKDVDSTYINLPLVASVGSE